MINDKINDNLNYYNVVAHWKKTKLLKIGVDIIYMG